jgi:hypothetical protein
MTLDDVAARDPLAPRGTRFVRIAGTILAVIGILGLAGWLWTAYVEYFVRPSGVSTFLPIASACLIIWVAFGLRAGRRYAVIALLGLTAIAAPSIVGIVTGVASGSPPSSSALFRLVDVLCVRVPILVSAFRAWDQFD